MKHRPFRLLTLLAAISLGLLACDLGTFTSSKPTVIVSAPPSGSQFKEGEEVAVQSTSTDSAGIIRVELAVDGSVVRTDPLPGPQVSYPLIQTWKATPGTHTLTVRAFNRSNVGSDPAAVSITVLGAGGTSVPTGTAPGSPFPATVTLIPVPPTATTAPSGCTNNATFVADVTVPDGTVLAAGQTFNKIWRLKNAGSCNWGAGYQFVFLTGEAMTSATTVPVPETIAGATADILVGMKAPTAAGVHTGQWRLKSPGGTLFGIIVNVTINVPGPSPTPRACAGVPNIASFTASPSTIAPGQSSTLTFGLVGNAEEATIDNGIGGVETPGTRLVSPTTTTTYTLTARCGSNTKTAQVTVTVTTSFAITNLSASVSPATPYTGPCLSGSFIFSGTITTNGPGTVTYRWDRKNGTGNTQSIDFGSAGTKTVAEIYPSTLPGDYWAVLHALSPNDIATMQVPFTNSCTSP